MAVATHFGDFRAQYNTDTDAYEIGGIRLMPLPRHGFAIAPARRVWSDEEQAKVRLIVEAMEGEVTQIDSTSAQGTFPINPSWLDRLRILESFATVDMHQSVPVPF